MITLFIYLMTTSFAKTPASDYSQAQELWKNFRACQSVVKDELKLINCVDGLIDPTITRYEKGKLTSFLIMDYSFSDLHSCEGIKNLLPSKPSKNEKYYCMDVLGNTSKLPGFISTSIIKGRPLLKMIKYND